MPSWVQIGESVIIQSSRGSPKTGVVKFVGSVEFASGPWVGVELDLPEGMHACTHQFAHFIDRHPVRCDSGTLVYVYSSVTHFNRQSPLRL